MELFHFASCSLLSRKIKAGTQSRNWWRSTRGVLLTVFVFMSSFSTFFIKAPITISPVVALPTVSWVLPYKSPTKKMPHRLAHRQVWWVGGQEISQLSFPLPKWLFTLVSSWHETSQHIYLKHFIRFKSFLLEASGYHIQVSYYFICKWR